jgi:hypothetical protein
MTSTDESAYSPQGYVLQKAKKLEEFFGKGSKKRKAVVDDIKERWAPIIPSEWRICRRAIEQAAWVSKNIDDYLSKKFQDKKFRQAHPLLDLVQRMHADNAFDRNMTLAKVGTLRGLLHPADLSEMATLIQTEFVRAGANFNEAVIYPGKSAQCLTNPHFEPLPFDQSRLRKVTERLKSVGFNLNELIALPASVLFEIVQSEEWSNIRNALLSDTFNVELQEEMRSIFMSHESFPSKLGTLLNISSHWNREESEDSTPSPIIIPSRWALAGQSSLGSASVAADDDVKEDSKSLSETFILDLESRVLYEAKSPDFKVKLGEKQTHLLSILIRAGESGLYAEQIKQLAIELERITWKNPQWESQGSQTPHYRKNIQQNVDKLKFDTNTKLKPLGLKISVETGKGRWYLETENPGTNLTLKLAGTAWEKFEKKEVKYTQPKLSPQLKLSPQQKLIWDYLWENYPSSVRAEALVKELGKDWDNVQTFKAIFKLKKALANENWMIMQPRHGMYTIIPKPLSDDSTTTENGTKTAI